MKKLWQTGKNKLDPVVEVFETGDDLVMDQKLIPYDVIGSIAHAKMLRKIGILTSAELQKLVHSLNGIIKLYYSNKFKLKPGDEDVHTAIENYLAKKCGKAGLPAQAGKKIHTGRSRNDQVLTVIRLLEKEKLGDIITAVKKLQSDFAAFSKKYKEIGMPGYTHMQKAMPSTVGLWVESFVDSLSDDLILLDTALNLVDQSPLGSGAGYGVPLDIKRKYTAKLLGFAKVQENSIYCQNSRGKFSALILSALVQLLLTLNKFASDIMLFTTAEFGFFNADASVCTGSSIMPQKKNVDLAELIRSKVHVVLGHYVSVVSLVSNLPSGYNRDLQDTKKPLIESFAITLSTIQVSQILLGNISPNVEKLKTLMTTELFATEEALKLVQKGLPFRSAYRQVKQRLRR